MDSSVLIKKIIRQAFISESRKSEEISSERVHEINSHLDKILEEFNYKIRRIALENNHPYVKVYLSNAIYSLKETIESGKYIAEGLDEALM